MNRPTPASPRPAASNAELPASESRDGEGQVRPLRQVSLSDRYDLRCTEVLASGVQALVRALLTQKQLDVVAGKNTAGYISGYRGSPLGGLDMALWSAKSALETSAIIFQPGVNEDLAATAIWGTQQIDVMGQAKVDGVFSLWYGKGPGVDRAGDVLKHANYSGVHPRGGVLAVFGDDHPGKSSTVAHHSEQAMAANGIPVLYPSNVQEIFEFSLLGIGMSRYSGAWVSMKLVNETAEQSAILRCELSSLQPSVPDAADLLPPEGVHYRGVFAPLRDETILIEHRLPLVERFAAANRIDRTPLGQGGTWGIVTAGKAYQDVRQALAYLGIDAAVATALGIAVHKVGMIWPLSSSGLRQFAAGRKELMFVEEKAGILEKQAASILYNLDDRPVIVGKRDTHGKPLISEEQPLEPRDLAVAIAGRLRAHGLWNETLESRLGALTPQGAAGVTPIAAFEKRLPYFCSGCPHNTSTQVPDGSIALAGIGCHGMAIWAKKNTRTGTHMGGEGVNWAGAHHFTHIAHVFQNLGDGTYFHSGLMAIRAAVASKANVTYKILFNDAVAMTGGQPVDGELTVARIAHQTLHEGVQKIVVVTDDPGRYQAGAGLPPGTEVHDRSDLAGVQTQLRETPGCTVMIYDQTCAAEKRRRRKRGLLPEPTRRLFINTAVCEGCGDCSSQSGCVSIEPQSTSLGRKRKINQQSCNKDYSCANGFCPSFVTVLRGSVRKPSPIQSLDFSGLDLAPPPLSDMGETGYAILLAGIGGTGVITVSAILAMAAHLEHKAASTYDMTGLSQKNGAVYSHLKIAADAEAIASQRVGIREARLVLGFDLLSALGAEAVQSFNRKNTRFLGNERVQETAAFMTNADARVDSNLMRRSVERRISPENLEFLDATGMAQAIFGDAIASNMFMLGAAAQRGWLPVSTQAIERAIQLNGTQADMNTAAFRAGRLWVQRPEKVQALAAPRLEAPDAIREESLDDIISSRSRLLERYQNAAYASRYRALVHLVRERESAIAPGQDLLTRAVAVHFAKLLAYKDEYEVARLYASPEFLRSLQAEFQGDFQLKFHLAPPLLSRKHPLTGELKKGVYGAWILPAMRLLSRFKFLRHTRLDPFGYTTERKMERALIHQYEEDIVHLVEAMTPDTVGAVVERATLPDQIRGYGHVKERSARLAAEARDSVLQRFHSHGQAGAAPMGHRA